MRIVVKVGTSTLAHAGGRLNIRHVEELVKVLSDLKNAGHEIIVVSSGAIGMGAGAEALEDLKQRKQAEKQHEKYNALGGNRAQPPRAPYSRQRGGKGQRGNMGGQMFPGDFQKPSQTQNEIHQMCNQKAGKIPFHSVFWQ